MRKVIFKVLLLLLPFLVIYPVLEYKLSNIPNTYNKKKEYLESQLSEIEILSTGSSHGNSINPQFLSLKGFNLSIDAEDIYFDVQVIEKYLDRMPNLKLIIMPISYFSLEYRIDHSKSAWLAPFYQLVWDIPPQDFIYLLNFRYFSYSAVYGWSQVVSYIENGFVNTNTKKLHSNGWWDRFHQGIVDSSEEERIGWQSVLAAESTFMDAGAIESNMSWLSRLIEICQAHKIKVIFITTPVYHYYYEHLDPLKYQRMQNNLNNFVNKYYVSYYNFLKDLRFVAADFYNSDHLNTNGTEKFSKILDIIITNELNHLN